MGNFTLYLGRLFGPVIGMLIGLAALYFMEIKFFPPVTDFRVTFEVKNDGYVTVHGDYYKRRPCELIVTNIIATSPEKTRPSILLHQIKVGEIGSNMPVGLVAWGPHKIPIPKTWGHYTHVDAIGLHRCHGFWLQETSYIRLPVGAFKMKDQ